MLVMKERWAVFRALAGGRYRFFWKRVQSASARNTAGWGIAV